MPWGRAKDAESIRLELRVLEGELARISRVQWAFVKRMLKFGAASWVFGMSCFISTLLVAAPQVPGGALPLALALLVAAAAVPPAMTAACVRRFTRRMGILERRRGALMREYEVAVLQRIKTQVGA